MSAPKSSVMGIFPTPVMHVRRAVEGQLLAQLIERAELGDQINAKDGRLAHTKPVEAAEDELFRRAGALIRPHMAEFGSLLFGEKLVWIIKEIWVNKLAPGGAQALHNHANSFISGIVYLTEHHPASGTVFHKGLGGRDFSFVNQNERAQMGPFSASSWRIPPVAPGDMILFPSYLLHEVPTNQGEARCTMAFNALPERIDSHGYVVTFS